MENPWHVFKNRRNSDHYSGEFELCNIGSFLKQTFSNKNNEISNVKSGLPYIHTRLKLPFLFSSFRILFEKGISKQHTVDVKPQPT